MAVAGRAADRAVAGAVRAADPAARHIGTLPALVALSLYALLPMVRNVTGLTQVPAGLRDAARALGLQPRQRWWLIDLPLAMPVVLAGVRPRP